MSYCELQPETCTGASDCPSGWSCTESPDRAVCSTVARSASSGQPAGTGSGDAGGALDAGLALGDGCPDAGPATKRCLPRYYDLAEPRGSVGVSEGSATTKGGSASSTTDAGSSHTVTGKKSNHGCAVATQDAGTRVELLAWLALAIAGARRGRRRRA
jgi:MYXO-CTERM domain-containing protein